jgi:hypothetical protein
MTTSTTRRYKVLTVEDDVYFVDSDFHPVTEVLNIVSKARYSLAHAIRSLQSLRSRHPAFFVRQFVEPSQGIVDIRPSDQRFQESL